MTLRRKIMLAIIILICIPVTIMGLFSYLYFSSAMERKATEFYSNSLLETDRKLQYVMGEIEGISDLFIVQPLVQQYLKQSRGKAVHPLSGSLGEDRQLASDLTNLLMAHPKIHSLSLYSNTHLLYYSNETANVSMAELKGQLWFGEMAARRGQPYWIGPSDNLGMMDSGKLLTQVRLVKDYYTLEDIGVIMLTVKTDILENLFWEAAADSRGDILLVNSSGEIMYSKSGDMLGRSIDFPFLQPSDTLLHSSYTDTIDGNKMFITYVSSQISGWHLAAVTPKQELHAESVNIRNIALGLLILSLISVLAFDLLFVSPVVKSMSRVVSGMKQVENGRFIEVPRFRRMTMDESGLLLQGFNRMSKQIRELIGRVEEGQRRKKQAELQALVAQINPHFIYNSLESINSMAVLQGNKEISRMVISLGKLLRISISEHQEMITLAKEMEHVEHYLRIQKIRFEDKFEYEIVVPEELKHTSCMSLIIQPLVENALYHGIERMRGKGFIRIAAHASKLHNDLIIDVADNGPGMTEERLRQLFVESLEEAVKHKQSGVGLRNVHERIQIHYGDPYGLMICSAAGEGAVVRVRIPLEGMFTEIRPMLSSDRQSAAASDRQGAGQARMKEAGQL